MNAELGMTCHSRCSYSRAARGSHTRAHSKRTHFERVLRRFSVRDLAGLNHGKTIQIGKAPPRRGAACCAPTEPTIQKMNFPENQKVRCPVRLPASLENCGPLAVAVMTPKFAVFEVEKVVLGLPKFGVLVTAKAFTRNWNFTRSVIGKFRNKPVSKSKKPGPRRMLRPAVPYRGTKPGTVESICA